MFIEGWWVLVGWLPKKFNICGEGFVFDIVQMRRVTSVYTPMVNSGFVDFRYHCVDTQEPRYMRKTKIHNIERLEFTVYMSG